MPTATVIPELAYPDAGEAIEWLCNAFGFTVRLRIADHRAQLNVGDGAIVVTGMGPETRRNEAMSVKPAALTHSVMVRVENVDVHYGRAIQNGARLLEPPTTYSYGERQYSVEDFAGHLWTFSESVADVDPRTWGGEFGTAV
jgi:uncharacterized glyoxalase superfamily protein PhnB